MAILNYTTSIDSDKSIGEIQKCLAKHGAHKIVTDYEKGKPTAVTFCLMLNGSMVAFALPANYSGVLKAMRNDRKVPRSKCTDEQAQRVSWGWKSFFVYAFTPQQVFSQVDAVTRGKKHIGIWISRYNFDGSIAKFPFFEHEYEPKR